MAEVDSNFASIQLWVNNLRAPAFQENDSRNLIKGLIKSSNLPNRIQTAFHCIQCLLRLGEPSERAYHYHTKAPGKRPETQNKSFTHYIHSSKNNIPIYQMGALGLF